jgi:hypothetical protein
MDVTGGTCPSAASPRGNVGKVVDGVRVVEGYSGVCLETYSGLSLESKQVSEKDLESAVAVN